MRWSTTVSKMVWTAVGQPGVTWVVNTGPVTFTDGGGGGDPQYALAASLGDAALLDVGTTAGTVAAGDDSRLTNPRTPTGGAGGALSGTYPDPGLNTEAMQDLVGGMAGTGLSYDDTAGTIAANIGTGSGTVAAGNDSRLRRSSWRTSLPSVPNVTYTGADTGGTSNLAYGFLFELTEPTIFSAAHHIFSNAGTSVVARPALLRVTNLSTLAWTLEIDFGAISVSSTGTKTASVTPVTVQPGVFFAASVISQSGAAQWSGVRAISTVGTMAGTNVANTWRSLWLFTSSAYSSAPASGWPSSGTLAGNDFANTPPLLHTLFTWSLP